MKITTLARRGVDAYLSMLRWPVAAALRVAKVEDDHPARTALEVATDRFDARLRSVAGRVLRDPELVEEAERRSVAADERERAARLRLEADQRRAEADSEFAQRRQQAEEHKSSAHEQAERERQRIQAAEEEERRRVKAKADERRRATKKAAARTEQAIDGQDRATRLRQLDKESAALAEQEQALRTAEQAEQLREAAAKTKAARKAGSSATG